MTLKLALAGIVATTLATPAFANPGFGAQTYPGSYGHGRSAAWELVGARDVSFRTEQDTIFVRGNDRTRQIMICVYRQPVRMLDVDVRFANGGNQDVAVRNVIGAGQCTRAIDLRGHRRNVKAITLTYKTANGVRLAGRFDNDRFGDDRYRGHGRGAQIKVFAR